MTKEYIPWSPNLETGVSKFDQQHKALVGMVNELHNAMMERKGKEVLGKILDRLVSYTASHFKDEEKAFEKYNYAEKLQHKKEHDDLTAKALDIQGKFNKGEAVITIEVMNFLKDWLNKHIVGTDKKYGPTLKDKSL